MNGDRAVFVENDEGLVHGFYDFEFVETDGSLVLGFDDRLFEGLARSTTHVEGSHRELSSWFANRLGGDDANGLAEFDHAACGQAAAVAFDANTALGFAGESRANFELFVADFFECCGDFLVHELIRFDDSLAADWILDGFAAGATDDAGREADDFFVALVNGTNHDAVWSVAIVNRDDDILSGVDEFASEVTRVGGLERGIGETFAGAVRGDEELENSETLAEVRGDRLLDDFTRGFGHLAAHSGELFDLCAVTASAGVDHHEHRVHVALALVEFESAEERIGNLFTGVGPNVLHLVLALAVRDDASAVLLLDLGNFAISLVEEFGFLLRNHHVVDSDGNARAGGRAEAEFLELVEGFDGCLLATGFVAAPDNVGELLLAADLVEETEFLWPNLVEDHATRRGFKHGGFGIAVDRLKSFIGILEKDRRGGADRAFGEGEFDLLGVAEKRTALFLVGVLGAGFLGEVVATERNILRRRSDRLAAGWREDVVRRQHEHAGFHLRLDRERHMDRHLVTVEVRVVGGANERVDANRLALDENRLERLNRKAVERRGAIEHHWMALGDLFQNIPNLGRLALDELLRTANGVDIAKLLEAADDEWLEQNKRHLLGKTALVELEFRADDDDRAARVVNTLAEEVLAETAAFALEHVAQGFQWTVGGAGNRAAVASVVEESVH